MDKMMKSLIRCCRDQSSTIDKLKKILPDLLGEVTSDEEVLQGFILLLLGLRAIVGKCDWPFIPLWNRDQIKNLHFFGINEVHMRSMFDLLGCSSSTNNSNFRDLMEKVPLAVGIQTIESSSSVEDEGCHLED